MRVRIVLVSVVLVGLALWLCWRSPTDTAPPGVAAAPPAAAPVATAPVNTAATPVPAATVAPERTEAPVDPGAAATPVAEFETYQLRFVAAGERQPVAGVEVHWIDARFDWANASEADRALQQRDQEQFLQQHGHREVADAEGRLAIRATANNGTLVARREQLFAQAWLGKQSPVETSGPFAGEHVVELAPDRELTLRAVDGRGEAVAGVFIAVTTKVQSQSGEASTSRGDLPPTDEHGIVEMKHTQLWGGAALVEATARASMVAGDGPPVAVDLRDPPKDPVDVPVPESGALEVALLWADGRPWTLPATSTLDLHVGPPDEHVYAHQPGRNMFRFDQDGRAVAAPVPCGKKLVVSTTTAFPDQTVDGPAGAGERVRVELRLSDKTSIVVGRVLLPDRSPFVGRAMIMFENASGSASQELATEADGRFRTVVREHLGNQPSIALQRRDDRTWSPIGEEAEIALRAPLVPGLNDVGDVVLAPAPVLVAGRLVDGDGKPAKGVQPDLERTRIGERESWQQAWDTPIRLDDEGRFEVRSLPKGRNYRIRVRGDGTPMQPIEFAPGTTDLVIKVERGGSVRATFLADPLLESLSFRLVPPAGARKDPRSPFADESGWPRRDAERKLSVQWCGLAAGPHRLLVACRGLDPLVDLTVMVPAGGETDDARLRDIDLRGKVRRIEVEVTDVHGTRLSATARVFVHSGNDASQAWYGQEIAPSGRAKARFIVSQPVELVVVARGCRARTLPGVFGDTSVALATAPSVTLQWVDAAQLPAGVNASLHCIGANQPAGRWPSAVIDRDGGSQSTGSVENELVGESSLALADGRATLHAGSPVPIALRLLLRAEDKRSKIFSLQPATIDPTTLRDGQVIELRCEPEALKQALAAFSGK